MAGRRQHGEGSVYHRASRGQWVAVADLGYTGGKRERREFTGPSPEIAMDRRARFLDRRREGFTMPRGRQPTVAEWCRHWLVKIARPRIAATTYYGSYVSKVEDHICPFFDRIPLPELTEEHLEEFHRHLEAKGLSAATIVQVHRIMSRALKLAVARGRIGRNPCSNVSPPSVDRGEAQPPTAEETGRILARCESWPNGARWVLAIATGIRQGEALALEWADVRLDDPASVTVRRSAAWANHERIVKAPKSRKSRRTIAIGPAAAAALRAHRKRQAAARLAASSWQESDLVFTLPDGRPVYPRRDYDDWQRLLRELGIRRYRVHDLRHGAATALLEAGVDVRVVQEFMGHASPGFTQAAYQHVRPVLHRAAADAMDKIIDQR